MKSFPSLSFPSWESHLYLDLDHLSHCCLACRQEQLSAALCLCLWLELVLEAGGAEGKDQREVGVRRESAAVETAGSAVGSAGAGSK